MDLVADQADVTALGQGFDFVGRLGRQEADAFPGNQLDEQVGAAFRRRGDQGGADEVDRAGGQLGGFAGPGFGFDVAEETEPGGGGEQHQRRDKDEGARQERTGQADHG